MKRILQIRSSTSSLPLLTAVSGILFALLIYFIFPQDESSLPAIMAAIVGLMAFWWIFEVVPIPVTALLPILLFPLFGIADVSSTGAYYGRPIIFLFLGGFLLALGLQESGIHRRIALQLVKWVGTGPKRLILGFMIAAAFLSMWISNTATVMVILPIALSILESIKESNKDEVLLNRFGLGLMLAIAYAADIGGMATVIGTPPNLIFLEMYGQLFPDRPGIGFLEWMLIGSPISILFLIGGWFMLTHLIYPVKTRSVIKDDKLIQNKIDSLGPVQRDEKWTGAIFGLTALLWITGSSLEISENFVIPGWRALFGLEMVTDSAVAIGMASLLFLVPSSKPKQKALLSWNKTRQLPWGILFLFGGGFAIAGGFQSSGLQEMVEQALYGLPAISPIMLIAIICVIVTFMTELASNSAITNLILPILASASVVFETDPRLMMIPATLSASCAFMMPIASPTQAIVFGSGYVRIRQMMAAGIWFNLLGVLLVVLCFWAILKMGIY